MVQGDAVALQVKCETGARLFLTTQANTRIYTSDAGLPTRQDLQGHLQGDSLGVVFTDPLVPHQGSRFTQTQSWDLDAQSSLVLVDWLSSGRSESGESFEFQELHASVRLNRAGRLLISDRFTFDPTKRSPQSPGRFAQYHGQMNIYLIGPRAASIASALNESLRNQEAGPMRRHLPSHAEADQLHSRALFSISALASDVHVVRALAVQRNDLDSFVHQLSRLLNTDTLLGCDPLARRL